MLAQFVQENSTELLNTAALALATWTVYWYLVYPIAFHPLARVPGPKICALSRYWILYVSWSENRNRYVHALHAKYGPIVRIGPNEVDISDVSYVKDVYVNNLDKSNFYAQFGNYGSLNTFSTIGKLLHKNSRKVSQQFYSKSNVVSEKVQSKVENAMSKLLHVLDGSKNTEINVFYLWSCMAMDGVCSFAFGSESYKSLLDDPFGYGSHVITAFLTQSSSWFWTTSMPEWYSWAVPAKIYEASKEAGRWMEVQFNDCLKKGTENTLVSTLLPPAEKAKKNSPFNELRAKSECFDHIAAGHNTTATTLSYFYYELARDETKQNRLIQELQKLNGGDYVSTADHNSLEYDDVEELPYLSAFTLETFRVYAAIPGQEPRLAPKQGLWWRGSTESPSLLLPEGTTVTMQPWTLHRDPIVFEDPDVFNPDRWLIKDTDKLKAMHKHMLQFGAGSRMCLGLHLATCEIKLSVANVFSRYRVRLMEGYDYNQIEMKDIYTTQPGSQNVPIIFEALK